MKISSPMSSLVKVLFLLVSPYPKHMKTISTFFVLFSIAISTFAGDKSDCSSGKIFFKAGKEKSGITLEICQNDYSQFYAKKCADGCDFLKALKAKNDIEIEDATIGSPGGQICAELGFDASIVDIEFQGSTIKNIDLCFSKDKTSFVSTGFLRDLKGSLE